MNRLVLACAFLLGACSTQRGTTSPQITGDSCALHADAMSCGADTACTWLGTGCACPPNDPSCTCSPGACASKSGPGPGSGSGSTGAACACSDGGVCFEQIGGPAQMAGSDPMIACTVPAPGAGDPCSRIMGQGTCTDSPTVGGLCVCDNGER